MFDNVEHENNESESGQNAALDYLAQAQQAENAGELHLALHLYLAAFEVEYNNEDYPREELINGLRAAWSIAYECKQRSLAEYIFELVGPYLTDDEAQVFAEDLQTLALDRLEEFGVSRDEVESVLDAIPQMLRDAEQGFYGMGNVAGHPAFMFPPMDALNGAPRLLNLGAMSSFPTPEEIASFVESFPVDPVDFSQHAEKGSCGCSGGDDCACGEEDHECTCHADDAEAAEAAPSAEEGRDIEIQGEQKSPDAQKPGFPGMGFPFPGMGGGMIPPFMMGAYPPKKPAEEEMDVVTFADMAGFENAMRDMRSFGIGSQDDTEFMDFIAMLNEKHGLSGMPVADTLLFRSPAREDADRFMEGVFGELKLPGVRIHMEENLQGMPVLCVMAQTNSGLKMNAARNEFEGAGVLLLEDIDLWSHLIPSSEEEGAHECPHQAHGPRGPKEAVRLIRSAVENPDVYVLCSCEDGGHVEDSFLDLLEPISLVQIGYPTESERRSLWEDIVKRHPSVADADIDSLVAFSAKLPRYDICMAAREAVDTAYKSSLASQKYEPVTTALLFEKLAAYQPLDSAEYHSLEDAVIEDFRLELGDIDDILNLDGIDNLDDLFAEGPHELDQ